MFHLRTHQLMALLGVVVFMENGSRTFAKRIHAEKLHGEHPTKKALSESSDTPVRNKTFIKYDVPANYDEAHRACKEMQGRLALPVLHLFHTAGPISYLMTTTAKPPQSIYIIFFPPNKEEDGQIRKVVGVGFSKYPFAMSPRYWLGADDRQNEGNWVDCSTGQPLKFFNFHQTQPDNNGGSEDCLVTSPYIRWWNDINCNYTADGYVCEFTGYIVK